MRRTIQINNLTCEYFYADSQQVAYILTPMSLNDKDVEALTAKYNINLIVISGMDWNDDMTPWSAPGITRGEKDFGNNAEAFLATLTNKIIPEAEATFALNPTARILAGISLSGMFALWAWFKSDVFSTIISISGSLWYPDFADWFCKQPIINSHGKIYLSLGDKEAKTKSAPFNSVNDATLQIVDYLKQNHIDVHFEYSQGNHFSPVIPRIDRAFSAVL